MENRLIIKSKSIVLLEHIIIAVCAIAAFFVLLVTLVGFEPLLIVPLVVFAMQLYFITVFCRKYTFDETGCTVEFLWIKKHFSWEQLKYFSLTKNDNPRFFFSDTYGLYGMEFCSRDIDRSEFIRKSRKESMEGYAVWKHTFSYIFIYFYRNQQEYNRICYYPCNMDEFLVKLMDWGVIPHQDIEEFIHKFEVRYNLPEFNLKKR